MEVRLNRGLQHSTPSKGDRHVAKQHYSGQSPQCNSVGMSWTAHTVCQVDWILAPKQRHLPACTRCCCCQVPCLPASVEHLQRLCAWCGQQKMISNERLWETYQHAPGAAAARLSVDQLLQHAHSILATSKGSIGHCCPLQRLGISAACLNLLAQLCDLLL